MTRVLRGRSGWSIHMNGWQSTQANVLTFAPFPNTEAITPIPNSFKGEYFFRPHLERIDTRRPYYSDKFDVAIDDAFPCIFESAVTM